MIIKPQKGPQEAFLACPADIAIYGGAAGGGKSYALIMESIRHWDNPKFGAVIFRKNQNQIFAEGGLWHTAMEIYPFLDAIPKKTPKPHWILPSGARIHFAHLETELDVLNWQGSQIPLIGFDELTHFSKSQFFYMLSRNRSTSGVKGYIRATCNPDADSWVADFISWWIDEQTGYPIPERSGVIRWLYRQNDTLYWADKKEELWETFDLKTEAEKNEPKSVTFIASKLSDNKILMKNDPGYLANLKALPTVERERLLEGNWKIKPSAGLYFPRNRINLLEDIPSDVTSWVRAWDLAASEDRKNNPKGSGPAYTAGVLIGQRKNGRYMIADVINRRMNASEVRSTIFNTAKVDKAYFKNVRIRMSQDPGQAGKEQAEQYLNMLSGFSVAIEKESGDKETRAEPLSAQWIGQKGSEKGNVDVLCCGWTEKYLSQMENFPDGRYKDMVDASANGFNELLKKK